MKLIVACTPGGGIGYENRLPWTKIQGDLPRFKKLTKNKVVVMGWNTWESLPVKPLKDRINIVITTKFIDKDELPPKTIMLPRFLFDHKSCWLIGGAQMIETHWDMIDEIHLTKTFTEYTCDKFINLVKIVQEFNQIHDEKFEDHFYQIWKRK